MKISSIHRLAAEQQKTEQRVHVNTKRNFITLLHITMACQFALHHKKERIHFRCFWLVC